MRHRFQLLTVGPTVQTCRPVRAPLSEGGDRGAEEATLLQGNRAMVLLVHYYVGIVLGSFKQIVPYLCSLSLAQAFGKKQSNSHLSVGWGFLPVLFSSFTHTPKQHLEQSCNSIIKIRSTHPTRWPSAPGPKNPIPLGWAWQLEPTHHSFFLPLQLK